MSSPLDASPALPVFDLSSLMARVDGDVRIMLVTVNAFAHDGHVLIRSAREALQAARWNDAARHAHSLQGASASASALSITELAAQLENAIRHADVTQSTRLLRLIDDEFKSYCDQVQRLAGPDLQPGAPATSASTRTLIVEDNFTHRCMLQSFLSPFGPCDIAIDGREAIDAFELASSNRQPYDLICLDIRMPRLDGRDVLHAIRQAESQRGIQVGDGVKIIMTTVLSTAHAVMESFRAFCDGYLVKPVDRMRLLKLLIELGLIRSPNRAAGAA